MQLAAELAREVATQAGGRRVRVAGVLPPAGESYEVQTVSQLEAAQPALSEVSPGQTATDLQHVNPGCCAG